MIIAISGVPGVGKSQVAALLAKQLEAQLISITALVKAGKIPYTWDKIRRTKVVAVRDVQRAVSKITSAQRARAIFVIEGHLAHLLRADATFVLRCNPIALRKRLRARRWRKAKIEENVQAELLDVITAEALDKIANRRRAIRKITRPSRFGKQAIRPKLYEINTTRKSPEQTARMISRILKSKAYARKFKPGRIKWLKPEII
jgi:adenylate kinase